MPPQTLQVGGSEQSQGLGTGVAADAMPAADMHAGDVSPGDMHAGDMHAEDMHAEDMHDGDMRAGGMGGDLPGMPAELFAQGAEPGGQQPGMQEAAALKPVPVTCPGVSTGAVYPQVAEI